MDTGAFDSELFSTAEEQRAYEEFCENQERTQTFQLDCPALVCRWRMAKRHVPMLNRHIRALSERRVLGAPLTRNMLSWAKQHVEWSLVEGDYDTPDGVLMLVIDVNGNAAMTVGAYEPLADTSAAALAARAQDGRSEQAETGVAPEVLCRVRQGVVEVAADPGEHECGTMTLIEQLSETRGHKVAHLGGGAVDALDGSVFLVSDEHGVVPAQGIDAACEDGAFVMFLEQGLAKLFS